MATFLNTAIISADVMDHPPIDDGSGFRKIVNKNIYTFAPKDRLNIDAGGTAVFELTAKGKNKNDQDVFISIDKLGSIHRHPVAQLLFDSTQVVTSKKHRFHGTTLSAAQLFTYTLVTPDGTEVKHKHKHKHRPSTISYTFKGDTTITTNFSGVDVFLKTAHAEHDTVGANTTVKYTLTDPGPTAGRTVAAGLSSDKSAYVVGPEHIRGRLLGF